MNSYYHELSLFNIKFLSLRRFALTIRPKVLHNDENGYVLTTETGGMIRNLNGAISILRNWIRFNSLSSIKVFGVIK